MRLPTRTLSRMYRDSSWFHKVGMQCRECGECSSAYPNLHLQKFAKLNSQRKLKKKLLGLDNTFVSNFHFFILLQNFTWHSKFFNFYVGYRGWLPPSPSSVPSLIPFPHFWKTDRDPSGLDLDCSSPNGTGSVLQSMEKRNWNRSKKKWEIPISDQISSGDGWSSTCTIETGWRWSRTVFPILNNQHTMQ